MWMLKIPPHFLQVACLFIKSQLFAKEKVGCNVMIIDEFFIKLTLGIRYINSIYKVVPLDGAGDPDDFLCLRLQLN